MEPHNCWTPNSLLFGTTKPATSKLSLKLPTYSQQGLGYFAFAPVVDVEPSFDSEDASLAKQAEERRLRDEEEQKKRDEELAREWQLEEERRLQRRAREAEEARRGEECWVRSGGVLRDANGKRDMVRTQAIRDELKLREEEKLLMDRWKCYEADWAELLEQVKLSASRTIKFRDIPWPIDLTDRNTLTPQLLQPFAKRLAGLLRFSHPATVHDLCSAMPYRKISKDIKIAAMRLYKDNILSKTTILDYLSISSRTFDRILALWNATREVVRETNGV